MEVAGSGAAELRELGLDPNRWARVLELVRGWCESELLPSAGLIAGRRDRTTGTHLFGRQTLSPDSPPIRNDAIFLIASITKPVVGTAILQLVERGLLALGDRVENFIPEFGKEGKHAVTIRNLLTHTSGLPDMLPNNQALREAHSPLEAFAAETCKIKLEFPPGRGVQYQSMGFAILGEIITRVTGRTCAEFVRDEIFRPLGMADTALGAPADWFEGPQPVAERIPEIRVPEELQWALSWNWNSRYWRMLGAPWGGMLTTPADLARFAQMMLNHGTRDGVRILSPAAVAAATRNQLTDMRDISDEDRRSRPWGLGWRLNWPSHSANFGDLLSARTYGHWGATGTLMWIDPDREAFLVFCTTQSQEPHGTYLSRLSNAVAAALI